jgi:hypothetical protein
MKREFRMPRVTALLAMLTAVNISLQLPGAVSSAAAQTVTYRHPMGYTFSHPAGWRVEQRAQGTLILPADAAVDAAGNALEMIALASQTAPGISRPDDPQVIAFFEQNSGGLQRVGSAEPLASGLGAGIVLTFEGVINGIDARRRLYVTMHNGEAIYLLHEAKRDIAANRDAAARSLFASLSYSQPASDAQVVGQWRRTVNTGSTDSRGGLFTQDDEVVALYPDGRIEYGKSTTISGTTSGVSVLGGGNPNVQRGRYTAVGGQIVVTWDAGGTERFEYSLFMNEGAPHMRLGPSGSGARFYRKVN